MQRSGLWIVYIKNRNLNLMWIEEDLRFWLGDQRPSTWIW